MGILATNLQLGIAAMLHLMQMRGAIKRSVNYSGSLEIVRMWQGQ